MCEYKFYKFSCGHLYRRQWYWCGEALKKDIPEHGCGEITKIHGTEHIRGKCPQYGGNVQMRSLEKVR